MAGLSRRYQRVPEAQGATAEDQSSVYDTFYGSLPVPATAYAMSETPLRSVDIQPSVRTVASNASVVNRNNRRNGMIATGGRQMYDKQTMAPTIVRSSQFQDWLIGPQVDYYQNNCWYIAYPAATVMNGGKHNLALSQRIPQLPTRVTGGPGPGSMRQAPRFKAVQTVPRYSTMPPTFPTASTNA
jgi:hypothetical protein